MKSQLLKYAQYNLWANKLVCGFIAANLSDAQVDKEIMSSFPSVRKTLFHIWGAENIWLERLYGNSLSSFPGKDFKGTTADAMSALLDNSKTFSEFVAAKDPLFFEGELHYARINGEKYTSNITDVVHHVMNHSTFHRGQLITMFRQLGFTELFSTDYISFYK